MSRTETFAALLLALVPAAAGAAEPPTPITPSFEPIGGTFEAPGDIDRYTVPLTAGRDYAVGGGADDFSLVTVRGPDGRTLATFRGNRVIDEGTEFRARVTGRHTIEATPGSSDQFPTAYSLRITSDCRRDLRTQCQLRPGRPQNRNLAFATDIDLLRLSTVPGRRYALTVSQFVGASVAVVRADGTVVAGDPDGFFDREVTIPFVAGRDALYARIGEMDDAGSPYRIGLTQR